MIGGRKVAKNLEISLLLDFYGEMLTEKQRDVVELYYNADLSLAEIAAHSQITRQGVRDSIKRAEGVLLDLEARLGLAKRFRKIQDGLDRIISDARFIQESGGRVGISREVSQRAENIIRIAGGLNE
jgi:predicted DNA-binding protein YlxM (UPF0122 family)